MSSNSTVSLSTTLDPLPPVLRRGLVAVAFFGILSLVTSLGLFTFLTYRLCVWKIRGQLKDGANQFLILIYNLVLADIQQAMAFSLTSAYLAENKIEVEDNTTCWANGWFVSTGDLASGVFIFAIAFHTFFAVVKGRRPSSRVFYSCIAGSWIFVYTLAIVGVGIDPKLYVRAGAWVCPHPSLAKHADTSASAGSPTDMKQQGCGYTTSGSLPACLALSSCMRSFSSPFGHGHGCGWA